MGTGSSVLLGNENGRIYKCLDCGCICSLTYENYRVKDIELLAPCYYCLENLKKKKYNSNKISNYIKNFIDNEIFYLVDSNNNDRWLLENEAIEYARKRKIPYEELVPNDEFEKLIPSYQRRDLIKRFGISL